MLTRLHPPLPPPAGAFQESGPLWSTTGGVNLQKNDYSWNKFANNLFFESPAGVGFSYADSPSGTQHNDTGTAADSLATLLEFYKAFPEYATNPLWMTGESYAGVCVVLPARGSTARAPPPASAVLLDERYPPKPRPPPHTHPPTPTRSYIPMFTYNIYQYNTNNGGKIPLAGMLVGNGCVGDQVGICGSDPHGDLYTLEQLQGHGFISRNALDAANAACGDWSPPESAACQKAVSAAEDEAGSNFDIYDLYAGSWNVCGYLSQRRRERRPVSPASSLGRIRARMDAAAALFLRDNNCTNDDDLQTYMNTPAVQAALHVKAPAGGWGVCGGVQYTTNMHDERTEIYPTLVQKAGITIVVYNGEADGERAPLSSGRRGSGRVRAKL